jgi:glycosyltransferase involved in cell wall biosynthesis
MAMPPDPPRVLAILPGLIPSTVISIVKPMIALHQAGRLRVQLTLEMLAKRRDIAQADVVIFCRNMEPHYAYLLAHVQQLGKPYLYDLDDNLFEVPLTLELGRYLRAPERQAQLEAYVTGAALVRVYAEPLRQRLRPLNPRLEKVLPALDWGLIPDQLPPKDERCVKILYATSRREDELVDVMLHDLQQLLLDYPAGVELTFWGHHPAVFKGNPRVTFLPHVPDYDRFLVQLAQGGFDIGLAPLLDDSFHRSKTNNKFREYGACQIAGVYSNVDVYASCVTDGETGVLVAEGPGQWRAALRRLIEDAALRRRIQVGAQAYVRAHYSQVQAEDEWVRQVHQVLAEAQRRSAALSAKAPAAPRPPAERLGWLAALARPGLKVLPRLRREGLLPVLAGGYQYLSQYMDSHRQLARYNRQLHRRSPSR